MKNPPKIDYDSKPERSNHHSVAMSAFLDFTEPTVVAWKYTIRLNSTTFPPMNDFQVMILCEALGKDVAGISDAKAEARARFKKANGL